MGQSEHRGDLSLPIIVPCRGGDLKGLIEDAQWDLGACLPPLSLRAGLSEAGSASQWEAPGALSGTYISGNHKER